MRVGPPGRSVVPPSQPPSLATATARPPETPTIPRHALAIPLILLLYAVLIALRIPRIVTEGRFWAEEGTVFFAQAWTRPPLEALFHPYGGYLNLVANAAALAARWLVPLEQAPYVTIATGLAFQLLPPFLLLLARDPWLQDWRVRAAGLLLLLFVPASDEIWLQTLHCQFELTLAAALLLALELPSGAAAVLALATLALAPLCGPGAIVLVPLFALRAALDRSLGRALQGTALLAGASLQLLLFYRHEPTRAFSLDPSALLILATVKHLVIPFLGIHAATDLAARWQSLLAAGQAPPLPMAAAAAAFLLLAGLVALSRNLSAAWLLAAAALLGSASYVGALDGPLALVSPFVGERYAFVPQSLLAMTLLALAARPNPRIPPAAAIACVWLLIVGVQQSRRPWAPMASGPNWRAEVAAWRRDPSHALRLWPHTWTMRLESAKQ